MAWVWAHSGSSSVTRSGNEKRNLQTLSLRVLTPFQESLPKTYIPVEMPGIGGRG